MHERHLGFLSATFCLLAIGCSTSTTEPTKPAPTAAVSSPSLPKTAVETPVAETKPTTPPETKPEEPVAEAIPAEPDTPFELEEGFTLLSFDDFDAFAAESDTWTATDDGLKTTGKPKGYLYSKEPHQNFTWRLEYRFDRPKSLKDETKFKGNTGFLVYITGEHKLWPVCLEVQGKHVQMAAIKENGGAAPVTVQDDEAARESARKPVGQWNRLEIVSKDGALTVKLNDVPVSRSEPNFLSEGAIGIQAEDHPFQVRRLRIRDDRGNVE